MVGFSRMTTVITITEMASMPGRFCCDYQVNGRGRVYSTTHGGKDPAGAAAYAVSIALKYSQYVILGPQKVLDCIPPQIRNRL